MGLFKFNVTHPSNGIVEQIKVFAKDRDSARVEVQRMVKLRHEIRTARAV